MKTYLMVASLVTAVVSFGLLPTVAANPCDDLVHLSTTAAASDGCGLTGDGGECNGTVDTQCQYRYCYKTYDPETEETVTLCKDKTGCTLWISGACTIG